MNLLLIKYLNSVKMFEAPNEGKSDAQAERDSISVESTGKGVKEPTADDVVTDADDDNEEEDEEEEENEEEEEGKESDKEESDEEKATRVAKEKEERRQDRIQKRIDKLTASNKNYAAEIQRLQKQLEAKPLDGITEEDIERLAEERANKKLNDKLLKEAQVNFDKMCDKLETAAIKEDKNFTKKIKNMVEEIGSPVPGVMMNIISDLDNDNGGAVLNYLTDNIDEAEELYSMSERRMTQKLMRISDKLKETAPKKTKTRSNLPEPIDPVAERGTNSGQITGKESMDDWVAKRNKQAEAHRKQKMGY